MVKHRHYLNEGKTLDMGENGRKKLHLCLNLRLRNQGPNRLEFFKVPCQDNNYYYFFQFEQLRGAVTVAFTLYA